MPAMIRTGAVILILLCAVLYVPLWVQAVLFVVALCIVRRLPYMLVLPAIVSDALYAPYHMTDPRAHIATIIILGVIIGWQWTLKKLRLAEWYGLEA
jgi:hypothetical protein